MITLNNSTTIPAQTNTPAPQESRGLPLDVEQFLINDIEAFGGLESASLSFICDRNTNLYGLPLSVRRRQIQNRVQYWKRLDCKQYRALLLRLKSTEPIEDVSTLHEEDCLNSPQESTSIETTLTRANISSPSSMPTSRDVTLTSPTTAMLSPSSTSVPSRVSQSASKKAAYIQQALNDENYGQLDANILVCQLMCHSAYPFCTSVVNTQLKLLWTSHMQSGTAKSLFLSSQEKNTKESFMTVYPLSCLLIHGMCVRDCTKLFSCLIIVMFFFSVQVNQQLLP